MSAPVTRRAFVQSAGFTSSDSRLQSRDSELRTGRGEEAPYAGVEFVHGRAALPRELLRVNDVHRPVRHAAQSVLDFREGPEPYESSCGEVLRKVLAGMLGVFLLMAGATGGVYAQEDGVPGKEDEPTTMVLLEDQLAHQDRGWWRGWATLALPGVPSDAPGFLKLGPLKVFSLSEVDPSGTFEMHHHESARSSQS